MGVDVTVAASASVHGVVLGLYRKYVQQTPATKLYCDVALAIQKALRQWHNHLTSRLIIDASSVISPSALSRRRAVKVFGGFPGRFQFQAGC